MNPRIVAAEVFVLLALLIGVAGEAYTPLSAEEAKDYMRRDPAGAVQDIIALDLIEHTEPDAVLPETVLHTEGLDLILRYDPAWIALTIGPLSYKVEMPERRAKNYFRPIAGRVILFGAVGLGVGLGLGVLLHSLVK
jgi:hypothetical protein